MSTGNGPIAHLWHRFWERAPRRLQLNRSGKAIIGLGFATGFAAINTGNNLLFLGWGLVLSAIVLSGVLSEASLRFLTLSFSAPPLLRAGRPQALPVVLRNAARRLPAFGVEGWGVLRRDAAAGSPKESRAPVPYQLKVGASAREHLLARLTFPQRGRYVLEEAAVATTYPFGFFRKIRRMSAASVKVFWVAPPPVDVEPLRRSLLSRAGEVPAKRAGSGDEFFALRPYRYGDDLRKVHWRRSARTGRWVVLEHEARFGQSLVLELWLGQAVSETAAETAIAVAGSLAEELLAEGYAVGLCGPGIELSPARGQQGVRAVLGALARLQRDAPMPSGGRAPPGATRVALLAGARPSGPVDVSLDALGFGASTAHSGSEVSSARAGTQPPIARESPLEVSGRDAAATESAKGASR